MTSRETLDQRAGGRGEKKVKLKLKYQGGIRVVNVSESYSFAELQKRLREDYQFDVFLDYEDADGDRVMLNSQNDLNELVANEDGPVHVQVSAAKEPEPSPLASPASASTSESLAFLLQQQQQQQQQGQVEGQLWHAPQPGGGAGDRDAPFPAAEMLQELTKADRWRSRGQHKWGQQGIPSGRGGPGSNSWRKGSDEDPVRWLCGDVIGEGAFGTVHMGLNLETGELMAVKSITLNHGDITTGDAKSFHNEIAILRDNRHDNIVKYYGSGLKGKNLSIFLEYMPGGSVRRLLDRFGIFEEKITLIYSAQMMRGLEFLHSNGVAHRDIKAANCLVDQRGSIKLADFGMSKRMVGLTGASNAGVQSVKGTPFWMAPEVLQVEDLRDGWKKADVWSLGATILEMATGNPPWESIGPMAAMFKISCTKDVPAIPDDVSEEAQDLMRQCLTRDPKQRPTVSQLLAHPSMSKAGPLYEPVRRRPSFLFTAVPKAARSRAGPQDLTQQQRQQPDDVGHNVSSVMLRSFDDIAEAGGEDVAWTTSSDTVDSAATTVAVAPMVTSRPAADVAGGAMIEEQGPSAASTEPSASTAYPVNLIKPPSAPAASTAMNLLMARPSGPGRKQRMELPTTSAPPSAPGSEWSGPMPPLRRVGVGLSTHLEDSREVSASSGVASSITWEESRQNMGGTGIRASKNSAGETGCDNDSRESSRRLKGRNVGSRSGKEWSNLDGGMMDLQGPAASLAIPGPGLPTDFSIAKKGGAGGAVSIERRVDFGEQLGEGNPGCSGGGSRHPAFQTEELHLGSTHPAGPEATPLELHSNASSNREDEAAASIGGGDLPLHQTRHSTRSPPPVATRPKQAAADGGSAPAGEATPLAVATVGPAATARGARPAPSTVPSVPLYQQARREDRSGGASGAAGVAQPRASPRVYDTYAARPGVAGEWPMDLPRAGRWQRGTPKAGRSGSWSPGALGVSEGRGSPIPTARVATMLMDEGTSASPLPRGLPQSMVRSSVSPCVTIRKSTSLGPENLAETGEEEKDQSPPGQGNITPRRHRAKTSGAKNRESSGSSSVPGGSSSVLGGSSGVPERNDSTSSSLGAFRELGQGERVGAASYRMTDSMCSSAGEPSPNSLQSKPGLTARAVEWKRRIHARCRDEKEAKDKASSSSSTISAGSVHPVTSPGLGGGIQRSDVSGFIGQREVSPASRRHSPHRQYQHPQQHHRHKRSGHIRSPPLMRSPRLDHDGTRRGGHATTGTEPSSAARYGGGDGGARSSHSSADHVPVTRDSSPSVSGVALGVSEANVVPRGTWRVSPLGFTKSEGVAAVPSPSESEPRHSNSSRSSAPAAAESERGPNSNSNRAFFDLLTTTPKPDRTSSGSDLLKSSRAASLRRHSLPSFPPRSPSLMDRDPAQPRAVIVGRAGDEAAGRTEGLDRVGGADTVRAGKAGEGGRRDGAAGRADSAEATSGKGEEEAQPEGQQPAAVAQDKGEAREK